MPEIVKTMKLHIRISAEDSSKLQEVTNRYRNGCNYVSAYIFDHGFNLSFLKLVDATYSTLRSDRGLRFPAVTYDEKGHTDFYDGSSVIQKALHRSQLTRADSC